MNWITRKLFGSQKSYNEDLAEKLYAILVLEGGPSSDSPNRIDASELEIPLGRLESFAQKRLISLEALLFVSSQIETVGQSQKRQELFGDGQLHPFAIAMGELVYDKWKARGIELERTDISELCFDEVELFLDKPFRWARRWLDEFYDDPEKSGEHYIMWTDQWLKEFEVMKHMVRELT